MKFTLVATVLLTFSLSAFAVEYPVLTTASPDQVGFDSQKLHRLDGWIQNQIDAGFKIKLMPDIPASIFW